MDKKELLDAFSDEFGNVVGLIEAGEYEVADLVLKMEIIHSQWEISERLNMIGAGIGELKEELEILQRRSS